MKNIKLSINILLIGLLLSLKSAIKTPPGTVVISEHFFMDKTEISNFNWLEYMYWNKNHYGETSQEYISSLPDTTVWNEKTGSNSPLTNSYLRHSAYRNYPVVGISYEQALAFCQWRSNRVNELLYLRQIGKEYNPKVETQNVPIIYTYRLPTVKEWEQSCVAFSKKIQKKIDKGACFANLAKKCLNTDEKDITAPVESYFPNTLGIYNMVGNVAEMTDKKGIAKGGSWMNPIEEAGLKNDAHYEKPTNWIGFRCVCEKVN